MYVELSKKDRLCCIHTLYTHEWCVMRRKSKKFRTNICIDRNVYFFFKEQARDHIGSLSGYVNGLLKELSSSWSEEKKAHYASLLNEEDEGDND